MPRSKVSDVGSGEGAVEAGALVEGLADAVGGGDGVAVVLNALAAGGRTPVRTDVAARPASRRRRRWWATLLISPEDLAGKRDDTTLVWIGQA